MSDAPTLPSPIAPFGRPPLDLIRLLTVEESAPLMFTGLRRDSGLGRVYGGQVIAQALAAADRTVDPDRSAHSLHAYFLRMGREDFPIAYAVENNFDGGSFSNRRVVASQNGSPILTLAVSFQKAGDGYAHHADMPEVLPPDDDRLLDATQTAQAMAATGKRVSPLLLDWPFEVRGPVPAGATSTIWMWLRFPTPLPDDAGLHRTLLAYASDYGLLSAALRSHDLTPWSGGLQVASLDHAIWFHEPFRIDDWLLYHADSPWTGHGRGFARGRFYTADGRLVAETAQEGVMRAAKPRP